MANLDVSLKKLQTLKKRPDGVTSNEWRAIQKGVAELRRRKEQPFDPKKHKAETQSGLAKLFIWLYFITLIAILLFALLYNLVAVHNFRQPDGTVELLNVRDVFMMVSSAITPILAFILGHYFKGKD